MGVFSSVEKYRVPNDGDAYRFYLVSRTQSPVVHHSRATHVKRLRVVARRAGHNIRAFLAFMHDTIVAAKMRRIQRELMCHSRAEQDAGGFPRRPLILGDKWDF
jgi:hypothetical protein